MQNTTLMNLPNKWQAMIIVVLFILIQFRKTNKGKSHEKIANNNLEWQYEAKRKSKNTFNY